MRAPVRQPAGGVGYAPHRRAASGGFMGQARRAQERVAVGAYRSLSAVLARLPTALSLPPARALFVAAYAAWPPKRRIVLDNASHVLGLPVEDPAVRRLARAIYREYARFVVELMRLPSLPEDEPQRLMRMEGDHGGDSFISLYRQLRAEGRGMIVVSGHVGSIDILAGAFGSRGLPTYGVADDSAYPELFQLLNAERARWGIGVIPWRNLREMFRVLRRCGILGLVVDWGYRAGDVPVVLFGSPTTLPAGPAVLAGKTRAPIVPAVGRRGPDGRYRATHWDPIEVADTSPAEIARATQAVADALEEIIGTDPEQWYSFKPMWPTDADERARLESRRAAMLGDGHPATQAKL